MSRIPYYLFSIAILMLIAPAASGAGNYMVAYESEIGEDSYNIYTIDLETPTPAMAYENARHPSLTAEGTLFFTKYEETDWGNYWKSYYVSYRGIEEITTNTIFTELEPTVSRNGKYVVFSSNRAETREIIFEPLALSEPTVRITRNSLDDVEPTVDADGKYIYYTVISSDESYIYKVRSDGTGQERLSSTGTHDAHPSVSGDNSKLAFSSERDGNSEIYVMDLSTKSVMKLAENGHGTATRAFQPTEGGLSSRATGTATARYMLSVPTARGFFASPITISRMTTRRSTDSSSATICIRQI